MKQVKTKFGFWKWMIVSGVVATAVLFSIWYPEFAHYYNPTKKISSEIVDRLRTSPTQDVFEELQKLSFIFPLRLNRRQIVAAAEDVLRGELELPGHQRQKIKLPFSGGDLNLGNGTWQLQFASGVVPKILLDAYLITGHDKYLEQAVKIILAWNRHEAKAWLPNAFLWNDHAVAARALVIANLWGAYRIHASYEVKSANSILQMAARTGQLLSRSDHFTFWTNHGVMQNLALLHLSVAFSEFPQASHYKETALTRLKGQMGFYMNDEGVTLEHSAGYHRHGTLFLGMALRYMTLLNQNIPSSWIVRYERAKGFLSVLNRPDKTLPMFGDTESVAEPDGLLTTALEQGSNFRRLSEDELWRPNSEHTLLPVAGYSVWWRGLEHWPVSHDLAQTVIGWSNYQGHGHKLADEMSVLFWADGQTWWTNVGYWPYGSVYRKNALSWEGSNAPHLVGEGANSERETSLLNYGWSDLQSFIDLRRSGPNGFQARRQVVNVGSGLWVVIDHFKDSSPRRSTITWTSYPGVLVSEGLFGGAFLLRSNVTSTVMQAVFVGSEGFELQRFTGSLDPFAGVVAVDQNIQKAPAFSINLPSSDSYVVSVWGLVRPNDADSINGSPRIINWSDPETWKLSVPMQSGAVLIERNSQSLMTSGAFVRGDTHKLNLKGEPNISDEVATLRSNYFAMAEKYPKYRIVTNYRLKVMYFLVAVWLVQELFLLFYWRHALRGLALLRGISLSGWGMVGIWLNVYYFSS